MAKGYVEVANKALDHEDEIQKTYEGRYDGKFGYLIMSNRKLLFIHEKGLFSKTYNLLLNLPYEDIGKTVPKKSFQLELTEVAGRKHDITFPEIPVSIIEASLKELIKRAN